MGRMYVECGGLVGEAGCSVAIAADKVDELIEAAVEHVVKVHGQPDTPALREAVRRSLQQELPRERDAAMNDLR